MMLIVFYLYVDEKTMVNIWILREKILILHRFFKREVRSGFLLCR